MSWTTGLPPSYFSTGNTTMDATCQQWNETDNCTINKEISFVPYDERPETYIVPIVFFLILVIGVTGNGILVLTILRHSKMRNVPNTYVLSLALGDLLVIVTCVPVTATIYTLESWPFGTYLCKISECAKDISIGVSVFTLTALSADRFFAIVDPLRKLHASGYGKRATRFTTLTAGLIWLLAIGFAIPASFSYIKVMQIDQERSFKICYPFPEIFGPSYPRYIIVGRFFIYYAIPLLVIGIFYLLMAQHLVQSTRKIPGEMQGQVKQVKARKKVARMVLAFVAVFAICFFPQHVYMLWFYFHPTALEDYNDFWHCFRILGFCLAFMNSCINPIALYFVSGTFRKYFNRAVQELPLPILMCNWIGQLLTCTAPSGRNENCVSVTLIESPPTIGVSRPVCTTVVLAYNVGPMLAPRLNVNITSKNFQHIFLGDSLTEYKKKNGSVCVINVYRYLLCHCAIEKNRSRTSIDSNRRGQSFSLSSRRQTSSRRPFVNQNCRRASVNNSTRWKTADTCFNENGKDDQIGKQKRDLQQREQETTVTLGNNGIEQKMLNR